MAKNILRLDTSGIEELVAKLNKVAKEDTKQAVEEALTKAGKKVTDDTIRGLDKSNLPAGGKYSRGDTRKSVIENPEVNWFAGGTKAQIGVGFDFDLPGAGGYLITGTPKMKPDALLHRIYKERSYMKEIDEDMQKVINEHIQRALTR